MSFLLKIKEENLSLGDCLARVSKRQSNRSVPTTGLGADLFICLADTATKKSHLALKSKIISVNDSGQEYELTFSPDFTLTTRDLTTDDLAPFRNEPLNTPIHQLSILHNNRVQRVIKLTNDTEEILNARFQ